MSETSAQEAEKQATSSITDSLSEHARAMSVRAQAARIRNRLKRAEVARQTPAYQASSFVIGQSVQTENPSEELLRARAQLDRMNAKLEAAMEDKRATSADLEKLQRAVAGCREDVRKLAGIPLPGNRRPGPERAPRSAPVVPLD